MNAKAHPLARELASELAARIKDGAVDRDALAAELKVHPRHLDYWLSADRNLPAHLLPELCMCLERHLCSRQSKDHCPEAYEAMNLLEVRAGRLAFSIPRLRDGTVSDDLKAIQGLVNEVGEALKMLAGTLEDGIVTEKEKLDTIPELNDVIRECVRLKHWLEMRCERDKKKSGVRTA